MRLTLHNGDQAGEVWGLEEGQHYIEKNGRREPNDDVASWSYPVSLAFLMSLPFELKGGTAVQHIGAREIRGRTLEGVLVSWGTLEPQEDVDQWVAWFDPTTKHIRFTEFTFRAFLKSSVGVYAFDDHQRHEGAARAEEDRSDDVVRWRSGPHDVCHGRPTPSLAVRSGSGYLAATRGPRSSLNDLPIILPVPIVVGCLGLLFPRLALFLVWAFGGGYLGRAFESTVWPILGFIFLPLTTLAFMYSMNSLGEPGQIPPLGWVLVVIAGLIDLGLIGNGERGRRHRLQVGDD